ncbi:hypothetical protein M758_10G107600 [Ceratodon purpureus]|nr:hypothetical protein M758_10G107600 [Ceratodon purpureus]
MEWKGGIVATIGASLALAVELTGNQHPCTCSSVDGEGDGGRVMVVPMVPMVLMAFSSFACIRPLSSSISVPLLGCSGMHHQPWPGLGWAELSRAPYMAVSLHLSLYMPGCYFHSHKNFFLLLHSSSDSSLRA